MSRALREAWLDHAYNQDVGATEEQIAADMASLGEVYTGEGWEPGDYNSAASRRATDISAIALAQYDTRRPMDSRGANIPESILWANLLWEERIEYFRSWLILRRRGALCGRISRSQTSSHQPQGSRSGRAFR